MAGFCRRRSRQTWHRRLRAEWTKFRTVRGWIVAMTLAAGAVIGLGLLSGQQGSCGRQGPGSECVLPVGPGGQRVMDAFTFVHKGLDGDGILTARVTTLTGDLPPASDGGPPRSGPVPWAKAGLIVKDGTRADSPYAAVMVNGGHGVRMQHDYVHDRYRPDRAGRPDAVTAASPVWLRLTRTGRTVTGEESTDGVRWTTVATVELPALPATARAGLFVTSPQYAESVSGLVGAGVMSDPTRATATFDHVQVTGAVSGPDWTEEALGRPRGPAAGSLGSVGVERTGSEETGVVFTLTGSGDIAPAGAGAAGVGATITQTLVGTFAGLIVVVVLGAMFVTAEHSRGLMRITLAAHPRRGRMLAAKALVIGAVTFVPALLSAAATVALGRLVLQGNGVYVHAVSTLTQVRVIVGTAALLALAAVLALALGVIVRRSAAAITTAVVGIVLPYLLAMTVLPTAAGQWLLRVTPAAAFALQQSTLEYPQVVNVYTPVNGYFPLPAWAGLAVLCGWTLLALGVAGILLRRRDA
jgi:ABC-type transport system involved in multi-copper enzyme maturation permease subunit